MKSKRRWVLLGALGLVVLLLVAAVLLPRLVDAESYRGLLRANLERQLGRPVEFGAMELSLWPVLGLRLDDLVIGRGPQERFDRPLVAESLRVGARLFPLLRGRLEVTSLIVERPVLTAYRRDDGVWEPLLTSAASGDSTPPDDGSSLVIERLRIQGAHVVLRWDDAGRLLEKRLDDLALRLNGLGTAGPVSFDLTAGIGASTRLRGSGEFQPTGDAAGRPLQIRGRVEIEQLAPAVLREWLAALTPAVTLPEELLVDRPFSSSATIDYTGGPQARLVISDAVVRDLGLLLVHAASGRWSYESLADTTVGSPPGGEPEAMSLQLSDLTIERASIRVEDRPARGEPVALELAPLRVALRQALPDAPIEIEIDARGGLEGRAALKGRLAYEPEARSGPARLRGRLEATGIDPRDLRLATRLAAFPEGLVVGRRFGLSAEIDATLAETPEVMLRDVTLSDLDLAVERGAEPDQSQPASPGTAGPRIRAERIELTQASLRITDRTAAGAGEGLKLDALRVSLDRLPTSGPATLELDARVGAGGNGRLAVRGKLGPLGDDPAVMPLDLSLNLVGIPLDAVRLLLPATENLDVSKATAAADLRLAGAFARELTVGGELSLANATVALVSPQGAARRLPFDLRARGDLTLRNSGGQIELRRLELELPREDANRTLTFRGSVDAASDPPRIDLELLPTRVAADDLAALAALLAPAAPLSFASAQPVELELRARGPLGGESLPDLEGRAVLSGFTFRLAGMSQPMERVGARVGFSPNQVTLDGLEGVIGKSDVTASRVVVRNFEAPQLRLELNSRNADFWELFSFVESDPSPGPTAVGDDPLARVTIEGTLSIERGSLQTLAFEKLTAGMDFRGGVLTLAPLEMNLYGGRFAGKLVQDLNTGTLTIGGNGADVDADGFLDQNLALGGLIAGRASTELNVQVRAADPANVLAGVSGGGPLQLVDGRLAKLDVLKSLSRVTGIFGERSLQRLTRQLATAGTPFRRAETRLSFDSGRLVFEDLVIEAAELTLAGRAAIESATGKLEGRFAVAFSPELSAAMREEQSRAAGLFWDPKSQRVSFGFGVGGVVSAPSVSVDWDAALRGVVERKVTDQLRGLLERKRGAAATDATAAAGVAPASPAAPPAAEPATEPAPPVPDEETEAPLPTPGLAAEITRTRWTGPVLLRDLSLEGRVRGAEIERVSLTVTDARGTEVRKIDRLQMLADPSGEAAFSWSAEIDGKRLLAARFPLRITVTVHDRQGRGASATRDVQR